MHSALGKRARPSRGFQLRSCGQEILQVAQRDIRLRRHRFDSFETKVWRQHSVRRFQNWMVRRQRGFHIKHMDPCTGEAILIQRFY